MFVLNKSTKTFAQVDTVNARGNKILTDASKRQILHAKSEIAQDAQGFEKLGYSLFDKTKTYEVKTITRTQSADGTHATKQTRINASKIKTILEADYKSIVNDEKALATINTKVDLLAKLKAKRDAELERQRAEAEANKMLNNKVKQLDIALIQYAKDFKIEITEDDTDETIMAKLNALIDEPKAKTTKAGK